jgi:hypothetical protein
MQGPFWQIEPPHGMRRILVSASRADWRGERSQFETLRRSAEDLPVRRSAVIS